jgi:predicted enzyme related to lactoylglutathione lyase
MSEPAQHHGINYIEFTTPDVQKAQSFYEKAFGWNFQSRGPDYISFDKASAGIEGGFRRGEPGQSSPSQFAPLIVLYSQDLKKTEAAVLQAGGEIVVATFEFPGGRRFHFSDGAGNVLAVWSE